MGSVSRMTNDSMASDNSEGSAGEQGDDDGDEAGNAKKDDSYDAREGTDVLLAQEANDILSSPALLASLAVIERAIAQTINHKKFLVYRNVPSIADILGPADSGKAKPGSGFGGRRLRNAEEDAAEKSDEDCPAQTAT